MSLTSECRRACRSARHVFSNGRLDRSSVGTFDLVDFDAVFEELERWHRPDRLDFGDVGCSVNIDLESRVSERFSGSKGERTLQNVTPRYC